MRMCHTKMYSLYAFNFIPAWNLVLHIYLQLCQEQEDTPVLVPPCIFLFPFLTVHTGTTNERLPYIITPDHKFPPCSSRFSRCPVIANRIALGPPLPVYCESAFSWKAKHSLLAALAPQWRTTTGTTERGLKMFEDV